MYGRSAMYRVGMEQHRKSAQVAPDNGMGVQDTTASPTDLIQKRRECEFENVDPSGFKGILKSYLICSVLSARLVLSPTFAGFMLLAILTASSLVGIQTYSWTISQNEIIDFFETCVLVIFSAEVVLKIVAHGRRPLSFFIGQEWRWNWFDFLIVLFSFPFWATVLSGNGSSSIATLRLMRLMRVMKLIKSVPQLQMIVTGLIGGLHSIAYIVMLLCLVFYLFAVLGVIWFRENDPFHFNSLGRAMTTLFRMATLEDWTDVMYINYYGCDTKYFVPDMYTANREEANGQGMLYCPEGSGKAYPKFSATFFIGFIVISAMVMLSLFIGAVTMSMAQSMQEMKLAIDDSKRKKRMKRALKRSQSKATNARNATMNAAPAVRPVKVGKVRGWIGSHWKKLLKETADTQEIIRISDIMRTAFEDAKEHGAAKRKLLGNYQERGSKTSIPSEYVVSSAGIEDDDDEGQAFGYIISVAMAYTRLASRCEKLVDTKRFHIFITSAIFLASVLVGIQTETKFAESIGTEIDVLDAIVLTVFIGELTVKVIAHGLRPWRFIWRRGSLDNWNIFDTAIVISSMLPSNPNFQMLRALRLLRVLKLVRAFPELQVIVSALINGFNSIKYIGVILVVVFYVAGIGGMMMFQENDPVHFGSLHIAMITLFRCSTLEDWSDVMYINFWGCNMYGYTGMEDLCVDPYACGWYSVLFFVTFTVISAMVLVTLFIGVVTTSMEEAQNDREYREGIKKKIAEFGKKEGISSMQLEVFEHVFLKLDVDDSGSIDAEEISVGLQEMGILPPTVEELKSVLSDVDTDSSGTVDMAEFVEFMVLTRRKRQLLLQNFSDGDGGGSNHVNDDSMATIHETGSSKISSASQSSRMLRVNNGSSSTLLETDTDGDKRVSDSNNIKNNKSVKKKKRKTKGLMRRGPSSPLLSPKSSMVHNTLQEFADISRHSTMENKRLTKFNRYDKVETDNLEAPMQHLQTDTFKSTELLAPIGFSKSIQVIEAEGENGSDDTDDAAENVNAMDNDTGADTAHGNTGDTDADTSTEKNTTAATTGNDASAATAHGTTVAAGVQTIFTIDTTGVGVTNSDNSTAEISSHHGIIETGNESGVLEAAAQAMRPPEKKGPPPKLETF